MRRVSHADTHCSVARAVDVVGDPWTMLVVREAFFGTVRFEAFQRALGIPRATLSSRLDLLVDRGVLERRPDPERADRATYHLTAKGRDLRPVLLALMQWGDRWGGLDDPPVVLEEEGTGRRIQPVLVDAETGVPLADLPVRAVRRPRPEPPQAPR
ncbi:MAG TPA: helix-turn-helix domain-containing protein [Acidimicrobiales bacterium]|nr:helix-turn-helix domain-containing protein [Acidimicrobiales bacterium]